MWAVGCIFAELVTYQALFQGKEKPATTTQPPFQEDQLRSIFNVLGVPTKQHWDEIEYLDGYRSIVGWDVRPIGLRERVKCTEVEHDLLAKMLDYNPNTRISAIEALDHQYFQTEPFPNRAAFQCAIYPRKK